MFLGTKSGEQVPVPKYYWKVITVTVTVTVKPLYQANKHLFVYVYLDE